MNAQSLTINVEATRLLDAMADSDEWLGYGFLNERRNASDSIWRLEVDARVVEFARTHGVDDLQLFEWANSKVGRWFGELAFENSGVSIDRAFELYAPDSKLAR